MSDLILALNLNCATWPNVNTPVALESNPNAALNAYLERQGRNESCYPSKV